MRFHPYADCFPLIEGEEFTALVEDIRTQGLLEAITIHNGTILDGRNRWRACQELGIPHREVTYGGSDPMAFVASKNLMRRQLTTSQRAMAAAALATASHGGDYRSADRRIERTEADVADLVGVGTRTVSRAKKVRTHGSPAVIAAVQSGELGLDPAERLVSQERDHERQEELLHEATAPSRRVTAPPNRRGENARRTPEAKISALLSQLDGIVMAAGLIGPEHWTPGTVKKFSEYVSALASYRRKLPKENETA